MAVSATLRTTEVEVAPGAAARCHVLVRNNSAVVDQFVFGVLGDAGDWTQIKPARANLMPQQEVTVELTFAPSKSSEVLAGEHPFALRVSSREDPGGSVVQEGTVVVAPFTEHDAAIVPVTSSGRRAGKHTLAVDNLGNHPHPVEITASDPDAKLTFRLRPHSPVLEPGAATFIRIVARPKKYFWKGQNRRIPFVIQVQAPDADPIEIAAEFDQAALIPRRFFWLFALLFALLLILVLIVTTLLRQRPVSIASTSPPASSAASSTPPSSSSSPSSSAPPSSSASPSSASSTSAATTDGTSGTDGADGTGSRAPATTTFVIRAEAYPNVGGGPQLFSYVLPSGPRYQVTSVLLRNPGADTGQVQIRHGGTVVGTFNLAQVAGGGLTFRPNNPPLVAPGERVTLAVSCTNSRDACTPNGEFTTTPIS
ncbi:hypothetical protein [Amycolatopsis sp. NPDC051071]|uniref:COG1470 family protein n=1 Tax=Amycolatopsis sp. NPDC051071 TaxID=3154637 RepID=UPI0034403124